MRESGILMPVASVPGPFGIGTLGKGAYDFVDFLVRAGQHVWQILPLSPTGFGDSPYQSCSAFAGNPYFIDFEPLCRRGLLKKQEYAGISFGRAPCAVDYDAVRETHFAVLRRAFARFSKWYPDDYYHFCYEQGWWLEDYALFMTAKGLEGGRDYRQWPEALRMHEAGAIRELYAKHEAEVHFWKFCQYEFFTQWRALKAYANEKGVRILGDIPIYVSPDSADVWAGRELFWLDEAGLPREVAGCPPDYFSADGQLWGNPLYNWDRHESTHYDWWIKRVRFSLELYDTVRIDHFRGFDTYYAIPYGASNARGGEWRQGPGMRLWGEVLRAVPGAAIVAEDLGEMFESVRALLKETGFPGMKVLQFAFGAGPDSDHLPHNYTENCVAYPGTHDNTTLRDWWRTAHAKEKRHARAYIGLSAEEGETEGLLRGVLQSPARLAVVPMADWLGLGKEGRINTPGTIFRGNWRWRCEADFLTPRLAKHIYMMCNRYGRA